MCVREMSNCGASTMSLIGQESKHFPTFPPDLQWETALPTNNSSFLITSSPTTFIMPPPYATTSPFDSESLISQLPPLEPLHFLTESTAFKRPEPNAPAIEFCTFRKLQSGIADDDFSKYGFAGQNFSGRSPAIVLNLGYRTYFPSYDDTAMKKLCNWSRRALNQLPRRCQAEGCKVDLSNGKHYHRRHKVCEFHSKASKVVIKGVLQRFCQQCSRFHMLEEFDGVKRSCRKRLADHNRRRRKSQPSACESNADNFGESCENKSDLTEGLNHSPSSQANEEEASRAAVEVSQVAKRASAEAHALLMARSSLMAINNTNPVNNKKRQALHHQDLSVELLKTPQ